KAGDKVLVWGAAGGLGVFATQLCAMAGAQSVGVVSSPEKGELVKQLGAVDFIDRNDFAGMMRKGGESKDEEKARFKESRRFSKRVMEILGEPPDIVFEHVGKATFPTSVLTVRPFGNVVIPWYATVWRGDRFAAALADIAPVALRYGATHYEVLRSRDDRYRMQQTATFDRKLDFERYWYGPEFEAFRGEYSSWYQVPI